MRKLKVPSLGDGRWRRPLSWVLGAVLLTVVFYYGLQAILVKGSSPVRLIVYGFSTQEEAFTQAIFPAFRQAWASSTGQNVTLEGVFGPSGTLAGQINLGAPADVAFFSNANHVSWLKLGRRVRQDTQPVVVGCTPMVIVTRPGNPFDISDYGDLGEPGLSLLHADPRTSGAGEWALLAEYGSALAQSDGQVQARTQLKAIWNNVRLLAPSARAGMTYFELGAGDALVTYEQDALLALERGVALEIVVPPRTMVAQHVVTIIDDNVMLAERSVAQGFVDYLVSEAGQQSLGLYHVRPPDCGGGSFPPMTEVLTVEHLGGWPQAYINVIDGQWQSSIAPVLELESIPGGTGRREWR